MVVSHRDLYRSVMADFASAVAPIPVVSTANMEATTKSEKRVWLDGELLSLEPWNDQRNADYVSRGTFRFRGFWRVGLGVPSAGGEQPFDERFRLAEVIQSAMRGRDIAITDCATGTGVNQVAVVSFSEMPSSIVEPIDGIGIVLVQAEFWLS